MDQVTLDRFGKLAAAGEQSIDKIGEQVGLSPLESRDYAKALRDCGMADLGWVARTMSLTAKGLETYANVVPAAAPKPPEKAEDAADPEKVEPKKPVHHQPHAHHEPHAKKHHK